MSVRIIKNTEKPESTEILAEAIIRIGDAMERLTRSGLNRRAVVALIHDQTKIGKTDIETILDALTRLKGWYCR